ncbi:efflux RND transporter periplasmic adaptor subunit [Mesorhizobium sp. WSM4976]|uniref:efflux RND transporter periplasmic adaptor subunit n=1 Tax=Mesorhizobium sp. WSM4976 TaxID=3038549 RepID=UPI0024178A92|nr:efflux RND transporter periplasmic adaptor subunit [Mesorhizobium sp. WSM4976]MDG4898785.1 efflux RND transporter periplasmic adaptor subunit [Mesorhizobium sp. WSM4976]
MIMRSVLFAAVAVGAATAPDASVGPSMTSGAERVSSAFRQLLMQVKPSHPDAQTTPAYQTEAAERGDIVTTVQAAGTLNALVTVEVGSQLSGRIKELYADFNSKVTLGQVIARVEPEMYEARVAQAEAELEMAQTQVSVQQAQIERVRAELETAEAKHEAAVGQNRRAQIGLAEALQDMERKRPLAQRNVITAGEWERTQNAHESAEAQASSIGAEELSQLAGVRAAQSSVSMADAELANMLAQVKQREAMLRQARIDLERTYIRAPVTGTVVNRAVSGGQTLAAGLQTPILFTIAKDLTQMQVEATVVEADISRFAVGQPVTFTVDAYPDRIFAGSVKQIRKAPQIVQNVVAYVVVVAAENPQELLLPGMTANLDVVVARREHVLKVPNAALRFRPQDPGPDQHNLAAAPLSKAAERDTEPGSSGGQVFVLGPHGKPRAVPLRLGITDGRTTEVLAGDLTETQSVIVGVAAPAPAEDATSVLIRFRFQ